MQAMKTPIKLALVALLVMSGLVGCIEKAAEQVSDKPAQTEIAYVASVKCMPFHEPGCKWAQRISSANLQTFKTRDEAINAGHRPCKVCRP